MTRTCVDDVTWLARRRYESQLVAEVPRNPKPVPVKERSKVRPHTFTLTVG